MDEITERLALRALPLLTRATKSALATSGLMHQSVPTSFRAASQPSLPADYSSAGVVNVDGRSIVRNYSRNISSWHFESRSGIKASAPTAVCPNPEPPI